MQLNLLDKKIILIKDLPRLKEELNQENKKSVFTNGCFDLIHLGHIDYLLKAKLLGDTLIVGVNSDDSLRRLDKGASRPIKDQNQRLIILAAFEFVDYVVLFDDDTPLRLIHALQPAILVKGGDYSPTQKDRDQKDYIVGSDEMLSIGNSVEVIPFVCGYSTSKLERKIIEAHKPNG
jgi:D-beta-D-heptose 7-phosphate kinase/D-beta-D-heptose 1-phosphate adenosyltransferase